MISIYVYVCLYMYIYVLKHKSIFCVYINEEWMDIGVCDCMYKYTYTYIHKYIDICTSIHPFIQKHPVILFFLFNLKNIKFDIEHDSRGTEL